PIDEKQIRLTSSQSARRGDPGESPADDHHALPVDPKPNLTGRPSRNIRRLGTFRSSRPSILQGVVHRLASTRAHMLADNPELTCAGRLLRGGGRVLVLAAQFEQ